MRADLLCSKLKEIEIEFFAGVPDSQLKPLCDYLTSYYGVSNQHVIAHNEGASVGLAAGYYLSTGKVGCVYMQNSGIGNVVNPITSLTSSKVYNIPVFYIIGWRGEPGVKDEPQHIFQGEITLELLRTLDVNVEVISKETNISELNNILNTYKSLLEKGKSVALIIKKDTFEEISYKDYANKYQLMREQVIDKIVSNISEPDVIVSTTGKISRELFEIREKYNKPHKTDFLTVGSMGHSAMIALGIAKQHPTKRIWCLDGDGSVLMHMGTLATVGTSGVNNIIHIILNNEAHETVGGMPTVSKYIDFHTIGKGCGYKQVFSIITMEELDEALKDIQYAEGPILIEIKLNLISRKDLGRPTTTPIQNKEEFMTYMGAL